MTEKKFKALEKRVSEAFKHERNVISAFYRGEPDDNRSAFISVDKYKKTNTIYYNLSSILSGSDEFILRCIIHENIHEVFSDLIRYSLGNGNNEMFEQFNEACTEHMADIMYPYFRRLLNVKI